MRVGAMMLAAVLAFPAGAAAMPFSYYREHKAWCDANISQDIQSKQMCANHGWCAAHWNDDRTTRIVCDPFRSRADFGQPVVKVSVAGLDAGRDLTDAEAHSACLEWINPPAACDRKGMRAIDMLPPGMKTARLALAASINIGIFPGTVVKIGIGAGDKAMMSLAWNLNGNGPRRTETIRLAGDEVDHLLAALNRSDFWRLPHDPRHMGLVDGEIATVEISMPGKRNRVLDAIGPEDSVDLSVLVNEISRIIARHWKNVPA